MRYHVTRIALICGLALLLFSGYEYLFGNWYGGVRYQKLSQDAIATHLLKDYLQSQRDYYKERGSFDPDLHMRDPFSRSKTLKMGFTSTDVEIANVCQDCTFENQHFKIAVSGHFWGNQFAWTIDDNGRMQNSKSLW